MSKTFLLCAAGIALVSLLAVLLCAGCAPRGGNEEPENTEAQPQKKATLSFSSFDGGGPEYTASLADPSVAQITSEQKYSDPKHGEIDGAAFDVIFTITGRKPGETTLTVSSYSPIMDSEEMRYTVTVGDDLRVTLRQIEGDDPQQDAIRPVPMLVIETETQFFYAPLADNEAAKTFTDKLSEEPLTLTLREYGGFEKTGALPWALPRADETRTAQAGDVLLYQGDKLCLYYGENTYDFTPLARIENTTREELLEALGDGDAEVLLYIEWSE